jgi:hypothetical protein
MRKTTYTVLKLPYYRDAADEIIIFYHRPAHFFRGALLWQKGFSLCVATVGVRRILKTQCAKNNLRRGIHVLDAPV